MKVNKFTPVMVKIHAGFPLFDLHILKEGRVIVCGGGGSSKSGVKNGFCILKWLEDEEDEIEVERKYLEEEDSVMAMDFEAGNKENCDLTLLAGCGSTLSLYSLTCDSAFKSSLKGKQIMKSKEEDFVKIVKSIKEKRFLVVGTDKVLYNVEMKEELHISPLKEFENEIIDFSLNQEEIAIAFETEIILYSFSSFEKKGVISLQGNQSEFRFCKFSKDRLYVISLTKTRQTLLSVYDSKLNLMKSAKVFEKAITCMELYNDIAVLGTANGSILFADPLSLKVKKTLHSFHEFAVTKVKISPSNLFVLSTCADGSFGAIRIGEFSEWNFIIIPLSILMALISIYFYLMMKK